MLARGGKTGDLWEERQRNNGTQNTGVNDVFTDCLIFSLLWFTWSLILTLSVCIYQGMTLFHSIDHLMNGRA